MIAIEEIIHRHDKNKNNPLDTLLDNGCKSFSSPWGGIVTRLSICRIPINEELASIATQGHKNRGALRGSENKITNVHTGTKYFRSARCQKNPISASDPMV
jgi:hypothetical protein